MKITRPSRRDKIRLLFFSTRETEFRQFEFSLQRALIATLTSILVFSLLFMGSVTICNILYQDNTNVALEKNNHYLKKQIKHLQGNIEHLNEKLSLIEEDTEDLEVLVGLQSDGPDSTITSLLSQDDVVMASMPLEYEYRTDKMSKYLNNLESRLKRAVGVQSLIEDKFLQTQKEIKHIPSIRPVEGSKITDRFGNRQDPFVERVRHHNGIDLSARYGTKVYAAAAGTIEFTRTRYRLNKGYGRVVIVNHGFGYKTLYGHLSKVKVKHGQKVDRWQEIGLSGDTGRATGPHLHYEVWHRGEPVNPEDYILN